jgi:sugar phosphate isomerase/epimerase
VREDTVLGQVYTRTIGRSLGFEVDVGSVAAGGYDPETVLDAVGDRLELVHFTEGADLDSVLRAAERNGVPWVIYENDHPEDAATTLQRAAETFVPALRDGAPERERAARQS